MSDQQLDAIIVGAGFEDWYRDPAEEVGLARTCSSWIVKTIWRTWHVNRYPGLACDALEHLFVPFRAVSVLVLVVRPGAEIKKYAEYVADQATTGDATCASGIAVTGACWNEGRRMPGRGPGRRRHTERPLPIAATGVLSQPYYPEIPIHEFAGRIIHTTAWDDDYAMAGRRVAPYRHRRKLRQLILNWRSDVAELTVYQRTPDPRAAEIGLHRSPFRAEGIRAGYARAAGDAVDDRRHLRGRVRAGGAEVPAILVGEQRGRTASQLLRFVPIRGQEVAAS